MAETPRKIAIVAPSSAGASLYPIRFARAVAALGKLLDCIVTVPDDLECPVGSLAGSAQHRTSVLMSALQDPSVGTVVTTYGGYNSADILPYLDMGVVAGCRKTIVGYSDSTSILVALNHATSMDVYYGPALLPQFGEYPEPFNYTVAGLEKALYSSDDIQLDIPQYWTDELRLWDREDFARPRKVRTPASPLPVREGEASGRLWGGNISTLNYLAGTPWWPTFDESIILFLEANFEDAEPMRFRRSTQHLVQTGLFERVRGLMVGRFPRISTSQVEENLRWLGELGDSMDIPVGTQLPFGHTDPMATLPIGSLAELSVSWQTVSVRMIRQTGSLGSTV